MQFAVRLLSPPGVADNWGMPSVHQGLPATGAQQVLIGHAPVLYAALQGMQSVDALNVLSLFGMVSISNLPVKWLFSGL